MRDEEDTQNGPVPLPPPSTITALYRALAAMHDECASLRGAFGGDDHAYMVCAADDALAKWLVARIALRRAEATPLRVSAQLQAEARAAVVSAEELLAALFLRVQQRLRVPAQVRRLELLRLSLAAASVGPGTESASSSTSTTARKSRTTLDG